MKAKVVAAGWGTYLNAALAIYHHTTKDDLKKRFWENIHFGRMMVWYMV